MLFVAEISFHFKMSLTLMRHLYKRQKKDEKKEYFLKIVS